MNKRLFLLAFALMGMLLANTGDAKWIIKPSVAVDENMSMHDVGGIIECYKVNGGAEESTPYAKFATLEGAIASANAEAKNTDGVNMYLLQDSHIEVADQKLTLSSGATLYLPYEGKKCDISSSNELSSTMNSFIDIDADSVKKYNVSNLNFKNSSLSIDSGAKVVIGGNFQETGVSGYYSQITLDSNSFIDVSGELICNGYIKEKDAKNIDQNGCASYLENDQVNNECDKNRYVLVRGSGVLKAPIAFYDAGKTMGALTGLNDAGVFPISVFDFPCLQTYVRIEAGAKFLAVGRMLRSSGGTSVPVNETIQIVKGSSDSNSALITLSSGYVSFEYCPLTPGFTKKDESKTYLVINGEASLGFLAISVTYSIYTVNITTEDKYLPFSYKLRVYIGNNGAFATNSYKLKFLPGAQLKILKGGQFNLSSALITYKSNSLSNLSTTYPTDMKDAVIICDGRFNARSGSTLGAYFSTTSSDGTALIDLSSVSQSSLNASSPEGMSATAVSVYSIGDFIGDDGVSMVQLLLKAGIQIKSDSNGNHYWQSEGSLVSYTLSIIVSNSKKYAHPVSGYQVYKYDSSGNETLLSTKDLYESESKSYILEKGDSFKVVSLDRAESTSFTKQSDSEYTFTSGNKYAIKGDTDITITPGEGILVRCEVSNGSGAGGANHKIYEKTSGDYNLVDTFNGPTNFKDIAIKKGATIKYWFKEGQCNFLDYTIGDHYLLDGIVNKTNVLKEADLGGTKLTTKSENNGKYSEVSNVTKEITIHQLIIQGGCLLPTASVLMADGTYKQAGLIRTGDKVISFNHETGRFEPNVVIGNDHSDVPAQNYDVVHLSFSNGKSTEFIYEHGYFDKALNKYVYLHEDDYADYIGHEFVFYDNGMISTTKLIGGSVSTMYTTLVSPATANNLNLVVDDMLSIGGGLDGLFNIFEYDPDTLAFDADKKQADIDRYGLLGYESFEKYFPKEIYDLLPCEYLGVSIGKGLISWDIFEGYVSKWKDQLMENIE